MKGPHVLHEVVMGRVYSRTTIAFPGSLVSVELVLYPCFRVWERGVLAILGCADVSAKITEDMLPIN